MIVDDYPETEVLRDRDCSLKIRCAVGAHILGAGA